MSATIHDPQPLKRLYALLKPERYELRMIVVFTLFVAILSLTTPIAIQALISTVMFGVLLWPLIWLSAVMFGFLFFAGVVRLLETYIIENLQQRLFVRVVSDFAHRLPRIRIESTDRTHGPEVVNRFFDVMNIQKATATLLLDGIEILVAAIVGMVVLAFYHPLLLAFDLALIFCFVILFLLGRGAIRSSLDESHAKYDTAYWMQEIARALKTFKSGGGPSLAIDKADHYAAEYVHYRKQHFNVLFRQYVFAMLMQICASTVLLGLGGYLVIQQQLTVGQLVAAELIVALIVSSLLKIGKYLEAYYDLLTAVEKIGKITDLPLEREGGEPLEASETPMHVRIQIAEHVIGHHRIEAIDWEITPGERVAITGPSGCGKSLILEILAGYREPTEGHLELDGIDLRDLNLLSVRQQVALVTVPEVFSGTISDNLRLGRNYLTLTEIRGALDTVGLLDAVHTLPDGMQTELIPTGSPLSQTQMIRLALARAIVDRPRLLILDGLLDSLDVESASRLIDRIFDRSKSWTLILVTKNPDLIRKCDRILEISESETRIYDPATYFARD